MRAIIFEPFDKLDIAPLKASRNVDEVVYIFEEKVQRPSLFDSAALSDAVLEELSELEFDPKTDYIVCSGSTVALVHLIVLICIEYGQINCLFWDSRKNEYVQRRF